MTNNAPLFACLVLTLAMPAAELGLGSSRVDGGLTLYSLATGDFKLGDSKREWSEGQRYEVDFRYIEAYNDRYDVFGNGYIFWEERRWEDGAASIEADAFGFGIGGGAILHLGDPDRSLALGLMPYARFGIAFQDVTVADAPSGGGDSSSGDISDVRFELALGLDLRAVLAQRLTVSLGPQFMLWRSQEAILATVNDDDISFDESLTFRGDDIWMRLAIGLEF